MIASVSRLLRALSDRCPRLRPLLPAAVLAASWPACHLGDGPLVACLGDSLTAGWRISEEDAWPTLVARALAAEDRPVRILNAGVSGETAAEGLARLPGVLAREPDVLVVALGINDGLRGRPVEDAEAALRQILEEGRAAGAELLLVGVHIPPQRHGTDYARRFDEIYPRLAAEMKVPLVPDLLAGVAGQPELLFPDELHPTAGGHARLAETVRPHLALVLATLEARKGS